MSTENKPKYPGIKMQKLVSSANIAELLQKEQLVEIGQEVVTGYAADRGSRSEWEQKNEKGMKLALQVIENKSFPWVNCSAVKFPLVTVAALQFLARVAILTKSRKLVKCEVIGPDPDSFETLRAGRISTHMSYQFLEEDTNWMDDDEKAKFCASIMGCAFKKSYFEPVSGKNISEYVPAANFVVDYYTKTLEKANRATHVLPLFTENDVIERERAGLFLKMDCSTPSTPETNLLKTMSDETQGITNFGTADALPMFEILEQHCWLDLDADGYREPYIAYVRRDTAQTLRIVARYFDVGDVHRVNDAAVLRLRNNALTTDVEAAKASYEEAALKLETAANNKIIRIDALNYFTKYTFIPSPDGGFYDFGFSALLGPINESVNTLVNQLIDAGTMSNTAGGFLGRGVKMKGGKSTFDPFEWKPVDSQGDDLRKNIVPLPVREPSAVLFQLLGTLISYGEKIGSSTDLMTG